MKLQYRFWQDLAEIERRRDTVLFDEATGDAPEILREACNAIAAKEALPKTVRKAEMIACVFDRARLEISPCDLFADRIDHGNAVTAVRDRSWRNIYREHNGAFLDQTGTADALGAFSGYDDFGHTCPDWRSLLTLGFPGILARLERYAQSDPENELYRAGYIVYRAFLRLCLRFADACDRYAPDYPNAALTAENFRALAVHEPRTLYQAMQLTFLIFRLQTLVEGEYVRSLGRLDVLYAPYVTGDDAETEELLRYCLCRYYDKTNSANIPFTIGGEDIAGDKKTEKLTLQIVKILGELNNPSPKVQVRVGKETSRAVLDAVLTQIRNGSSSFVFCNDDVVEAALIKNGHTPEDARDYVMIGCYESSVMGKEVACTCNGRVSLPKAVETALNGGCDLRNGACIGLPCADDFPDFDSFYEEVRRQISFFAKTSMDRTVCMERDYMEVNPSPMFSGAMTCCLESGRDVYAGGAKYNFSSLNLLGTATAADALLAVKKLVYEEKRVTFPELREILKNNWEGHEALRLYAQNKLPKYGRGDREADLLAADLLRAAAASVNGYPNGRGGVFRAGAFSIDWRVDYGRKLAASADGRLAGETLSKNMCADAGADIEGVTALIQSACAVDYTDFSNGTVLDIVLHETAVRGEDGLAAMEGLVRVFMELGGLAIQINVMRPEVLRDAQENPEKYPNLQVRLCGWNVLFVNLSKKEQDEFIRQAESAS